MLIDKNGCTWRPHPLVLGEFQILLDEDKTQVWSDADLMPEDGPFTVVCDLRPCRICPVESSYDYLPELVRHLT